MPDMQFGRYGPPPAVIADQMRQMAAQLQARRAAGGQLYQMYGGQPQGAPQPPMAPPGGIAPPPAGTPQGGPMPPPPGANPAPMPNAGGMPQPQPGMMPRPPMQPMGGPPTGPAAGMPPPAPAAPPPQIQPFRPLPTGAPGGQGPGGIAPPPEQPAAADAGPGLSDPGKQFNLQVLIKQLQSSGVPPDKVMDMLDQLGPVMTAQNKQELDFFKAHNAALKQANDTYARLMTAIAAQTRADTGVKAEERKTEQGNRRLDIMTKRAEQLAGGAGNLKGKIELIYPKDAQGKVDQTKDPIGTRATTKSGKIVYLDADGLQTTAAALAGGTASEDRASRVGVTNVVRKSLVLGAANNAINRLNEIETKYPNENVSLLLQSHGEGLLEAGAESLYRRSQSDKQLAVDQTWRNLITEAIPVLTGGLRGSDSFRRFLIQESPLSGTGPGARAEGRRMLRANIMGMKDIFEGRPPGPGFDPAFVTRMMDAYASDPKNWAPGVTAEEVQQTIDATKQAVAKPAAPRAPAAAPKAPTSGKWTVEKVTP